MLVIFKDFYNTSKILKKSRSQISKCCKNFKNDFHEQKLFFPRARNIKNISQKVNLRKNDFFKNLNFLKLVSHIHKHLQIDQNAISGNSAENSPTSRPHNFFRNGRTRLVYDSFWPQGQVKKICLGWFPQLVRPLRADLRIFSIFSKISPWTADPQKQIFRTFESEKNL